MEDLRNVGVAGGVWVHLGDSLFVGGKFACEEEMVLVQEFAVMASAELCHLMLDIDQTGQTGTFFHHMHQVLVLQLEADTLPVLHQLPEAYVLSGIMSTLWQMKEKSDLTPVL